MGKQNRFSKHIPKHRREIDDQNTFGFGRSYVDSERLIEELGKVLGSNSDLEWAIRESISEGPPHSQVRNALILNQLAHILKIVGFEGSLETEEVKGTSPKEYGFVYPIGIPKKILKYLKSGNEKESLNWIGEGPFHEVSCDLLLMNCLEAIKETLEKKNQSVS